MFMSKVGAYLGKAVKSFITLAQFVMLSGFSGNCSIKLFQYRYTLFPGTDLGVKDNRNTFSKRHRSQIKGATNSVMPFFGGK